MSQFLSPRQANDFVVNKNAIILDVRTQEEFCSAHLCEAIHIPVPLPPLSEKHLIDFQDTLHKRLQKYRKTQPILVYCKKGIRAAHAVKILKALGYSNVYNLGGVAVEPLISYFKNPRYRRLNLCTCKE